MAEPVEGQAEAPAVAPEAVLAVERARAPEVAAVERARAPEVAVVERVRAPEVAVVERVRAPEVAAAVRAPGTVAVEPEAVESVRMRVAAEPAQVQVSPEVRLHLRAQVLLPLQR